MKSIVEAGRHIQVLAETQVLVVGGGPAGIAAALASARVGAKTMLVEYYGCFGGNITHSGVESVAWFRHEGTIEVGGILRELEETAKNMGASHDECQSISQALDTELFKCVIDKLLLEAGVIPLLHCTAVDAIVEEGKIKGIITESKSGRAAIMAQRVIDCTGDADVAAHAGVPFVKPQKEGLMAVTPMFHVSGVNAARFQYYIKQELKPTYRDWGGYWEQQLDDDETLDMFSPFFDECFHRAYEEGIIPMIPHVTIGGTYSTVTADGNVTGLNMIYICNIDCTDVFDLTKAEMQGRQNVLYALQAMRKYVPGFENVKLRNFAMQVGVRDSRRIRGHYWLTADDVMSEARFEDSIGVYPEFVDGRGVLLIPTTGRYFHVPYRALLPQHVDNLLVAGRCISGDDIAFCAFRNISCCLLTGQAAGVAAAISLREGVTTQNVTVAAVQETLKNQGVRIF